MDYCGIAELTVANIIMSGSYWFLSRKEENTYLKSGRGLQKKMVAYFLKKKRNSYKLHKKNMDLWLGKRR